MSLVITAEGRLNTKAMRVSDFQRQQFKTLSSSSSSPLPNNISRIQQNNSVKDKEELCFAYIRHFLAIYAAKFPKRKLPYTLAENESGELKFICTTLRPNQLPYSELYDMYECAVFIAGYIVYEPLDPPYEPPKILPSPLFTLAQTNGDSFDMAMLLCSLLLGNGYDAYVVSGYAPAHVTLKDQGGLECPVLSSTADYTARRDKTDTGSTKNDTPTISAAPSTGGDEEGYELLDNGVKASSFIEAESERQRVAALDTFELWPDTDDISGGADITDTPPLNNMRTGNGRGIGEMETQSQQRVHAWVLVKAGRRDVREHVFFEPSTGRAYLMNQSPYLGIESVWNASNYWAINKVGVKVSEVDFDLDNANIWTTLFLGGSLVRKGDSLDDPSVDSPATDDDQFIPFDPPLSWVPPLSLSRINYLLRYPPNGQRSTLYHKAKLDRYAKTSHSQGMIMRLTKYYDKDRVIAKEIHEWYEGRKDKLYRRVRHVLGQYKFVELYHPGSDGEVKCWTEYPGKRYEVDFYVNGRLDRLLRREETINEQVVETFEGRVDRLISQTTCVTTESAGEVEKLNNSDINGGDFANDTYITRITQVYARGPNANSGQDVAKKTFHVRQGQAVFQYHNPEGKIDLRVKTFNHSVRGSDALLLAETADKENTSQDNELVRKQQSAAISAFKDIHKYFQRDVVDVHRQNELSVKKQRSVFDTALDAVSSGAVAALNDKSTADNEDGQLFDYLEPYLRHVREVAQITREEALSVRQNCLDGYKQRLIEREKIIQARLGEEKSKLARKQEQYPRSQQRIDGGGGAGGNNGGNGGVRTASDEDYEKQCADAIFRIHVLEQRLAAHEDLAVKKYAALEERLTNDPRLRNAIKV